MFLLNQFRFRHSQGWYYELPRGWCERSHPKILIYGDGDILFVADEVSWKCTCCGLDHNSSDTCIDVSVGRVIDFRIEEKKEQLVVGEGKGNWKRWKTVLSKFTSYRSFFLLVIYYRPDIIVVCIISLVFPHHQAQPGFSTAHFTTSSSCGLCNVVTEAPLRPF